MGRDIPRTCNHIPRIAAWQEKSKPFFAFSHAEFPTLYIVLCTLYIPSAHPLSNAGAPGAVIPCMNDDENAAREDYNRALFRGCPTGSLQLAGELTERSLGYPLNVMSLLYYECGDATILPESPADESAPRD